MTDYYSLGLDFLSLLVPAFSIIGIILRSRAGVHTLRSAAYARLKVLGKLSMTNRHIRGYIREVSPKFETETYSYFLFAAVAFVLASLQEYTSYLDTEALFAWDILSVILVSPFTLVMLEPPSQFFSPMGKLRTKWKWINNLPRYLYFISTGALLVPFSVAVMVILRGSFDTLLYLAFPTNQTYSTMLDSFFVIAAMGAVLVAFNSWRGRVLARAEGLSYPRYLESLDKVGGPHVQVILISPGHSLVEVSGKVEGVGLELILKEESGLITSVSWRDIYMIKIEDDRPTS